MALDLNYFLSKPSDFSVDSTSEGSNFRTGAQDSGEGGKPEESPGGIASAQPRARR